MSSISIGSGPFSVQNSYANTYGIATASQTYTTKTSFRYPLKQLDSTTDYLSIKIFDYVNGTSAGAGFSLGPPLQAPTFQQRLQRTQQSPRYYITLPIPQSITDLTGVSWGEDNINPLQAALIGLANDVQGGNLNVQQLYQSAVDKIKSVASTNLTESEKNTLQAYISAIAVNQLGANVNEQSLITRATGQVLQSNLELLFQGVNLRAFPFTFEFAPRSRAEAQEVKQIIRIFKQTMSARNGGAGSGSNTNSGLFISSPSVYQLEYRSGGNKHPFLNTFKPCALTDISVNYTGSNTYSTYDDGTPVHMQMSLTFKEINPVYAEDYDENPDARIGVGY